MILWSFEWMILKDGGGGATILHLLTIRRISKVSGKMIRIVII